MRALSFALCGLAAFGLAACDTASDGAPAPETATGAFDAALFADADQLIVISNQADAKNNDRAVRFRNPDALGGKTAFFYERNYDVVSFQSALFDESRNEFYGTFDIESGTGGRVARFDRRGNQLAVNDDLLVSPKGLAAASGLIFVADVGRSGGLILDAETLEPALEQHNEPGAPNWDFHVEPIFGIVFGAGTDGFVNVYAGPGDPTDRFQVLGANGDPATNNHGITYDLASRTLIVSDVGDAGSDSDGALHVLDYDFEDRGQIGNPFGTPIRARATYAGANTMLGNPVDIAGSNDGVFVAEKANGGGKVLRFAGVLSASGVQNVAPAAVNSTVQGAESVDVIGDRPGTPSLQPPTLSACQATPSRVDTGEQVTLSATLSGGEPSAMTVDFGDGSTASALPANHVYSTVGTYTATITASNDTGSDTCTLTVTVGDNFCDSVTELNSVFFAFTSSALAADAQGQLDENTEVLRRCPNVCTTVNGYSDGSEPGGTTTAQDRADSVLDYYVSLGISPDRLRAVGRGAESPSEGAQSRRADSIPQSCAG